MLLFSDLAITPCNYLDEDHPYPTHEIPPTFTLSADTHYCIKRLLQDKTLLGICLCRALIYRPLCRIRLVLIPVNGTAFCGPWHIDILVSHIK